jgi:hypothetical protein
MGLNSELFKKKPTRLYFPQPVLLIYLNFIPLFFNNNFKFIALFNIYKVEASPWNSFFRFTILLFDYGQSDRSKYVVEIYYILDSCVFGT